jgi:hypothetical protein
MDTGNLACRAASCKHLNPYTGTVTPADLRRWIDNHRVAARVEASHMADAWGRPEDAIRDALGLIAVYGELHGWPPARDPVGEEEDLLMWDRLARLRRRVMGR